MRIRITELAFDRRKDRAIWAMVRYDRFAEDSEHDWGVVIFGGYSFEWHVDRSEPLKIRADFFLQRMHFAD